MTTLPLDTKPIKHLVIVAGEASGDLHAAAIIRDLKSRYPDLCISGIGGQHMQKAGAELVSDLARFGVTGISEVLKHVRVIHQAFKSIKRHLTQHKPDLLVLIDYPGFNLRLAKFAKNVLGIRILYYIGPQIWAWKANRIKTIRAYVDHMAVIFPFEKKLYQQANVPVSFVGHPLVETIQPILDIMQIRDRLGLDRNAHIIALLPGSRIHEIERHMPDFIKSIKQLNKELIKPVQVIVPVANTIRSELIEHYFLNQSIHYTLIQSNTMEAVSASDCAIVASGTASLECALLEKPMCIVYKGSFLTYLAATLFIKVKYLGLCNLLQNKMIVPELLQYDCNPHEITSIIKTLLLDEQAVLRMKNRLHEVKQALSKQKSDCSIIKLIELHLGISEHGFFRLKND